MLKRAVLLLILCLCFPIYADNIDYSVYTQNGGYITPSYGLFLNSSYWYYSQGAIWGLGGELFENNGYYHIYNTNINEVLINISEAGISATDNGNLYICVNDGNGIESCQMIGRYSTTPNDYFFSGLFDLTTLPCREGLLDIFLRINYDSGGSADSWHYRAYYDIEKAYAKKRSIQISSSNNLSNGVVTITLNSTITNELNAIDILYDMDNSESTLSGTYSTLIFTNTDKTKVYPFYIESFKGGYYNYSRNTTNETIIKIFINENITGKTLYMYYNHNISLGKSTIDGIYNFSYFTDFNNNPFIIHQLFSDWRWNKTFFNNTIAYPNTWTGTIYNRNSSLYFSTSGITPNLIYPRFINNLSWINYFTRSKETLYSSYQMPYLKGNWDIMIGENVNHGHLYNSSGDTVNDTNTDQFKRNIFEIANGNLSYYMNGLLFLTIPELNSKMGNISIIGLNFSGTSWTSDFYYIHTIDNISSTTIISNVSNTSFLTASIGLTALGYTSTSINDNTIYGVVTSKDSGYVACYGKDNEYLGSLTIPSESSLTNHNFIIDYTITNQTWFYNQSNTNISYYCCFYSGTTYICSTNTTLQLNYQRVFVSNVKPLNYAHPIANNVPHSIDFDYTNNVSAIVYFRFNISRLSCSNYRNYTCYNWDIASNDFIYNSTNPSSYSDICQNCNGCYLSMYSIGVLNMTTDNTITRIFCTLNYNGTNTTPLSNSCFINYIPAGTPIADLNSYFWDHPDCYVGSFMYSMTSLLTTDTYWQEMFLIFLTIFCNFYFLTLFIGFSTWITFSKALPNVEKTYYAGLFTSGISFMFFLLEGWIPLDYKLFILMVLSLVALALWKRNG